jgi:hypothetical protein
MIDGDVKDHPMSSSSLNIINAPHFNQVISPPRSPLVRTGRRHQKVCRTLSSSRCNNHTCQPPSMSKYHKHLSLNAVSMLIYYWYVQCGPMSRLSPRGPGPV